MGQFLGIHLELEQKIRYGHNLSKQGHFLQTFSIDIKKLKIVVMI